MNTTTTVVEVHDRGVTVGDKGVGVRRTLSGVTPLMVACQNGNSTEVRSLLQSQPALLQQRDRTGKTALHYCSENASVACADDLVTAAPELLDAADEEGYTPLHLAIINGNKTLVRFLIAKEADLDAVDKEKHSVIHWASVCGEVECLDMMLQAKANASTADMHGAYPLHYAAQMCGANSELGHDPRVGLTVLNRLLRHGVDVNVRDQDGRQPLLWAASAGSSEAMIALFNAGATVTAKDKDGLTALHCAASRGHSDCLETLLTLCSVDVDMEDHNGCTPLFYAVTLGHADCVALLLGQGANPNHQDRKGRTPAHCGAAKAQLETIKILAKNDADLWRMNNRGDLPLHEAVQSGRKDLVLWLLAQRPTAINASNNDGRTCLHIAALNNNVELCKVLIDNGAEVNPVMKNNKGQTMTPLDAAVFRNNRGCANYLQLHGGAPAHKLNDKALLRISYRGLETQANTPPTTSVTPEVDAASTGSGAQEKSIQTTIQQDSDHEDNDAAPVSEASQEGSRQLENIPEEQDVATDETKGKNKDNASITSEENSSPRNKDSGFSDNNRGGGNSDVDGSDVLSSPTGEITYIDNGEVVSRRRRRARKSRTMQGRGGDSESELSEKGKTNEGGKTAGRHQMRFRSEPETSFFRPTTNDRSLPGVNNGRLRVHQKERRIFQELMELNRVRINADRSEEQFIVRKLSDNYRHQGLIVGNLRFMGPFTFHQYEKYLFDQLRQLSGSSVVGGNSQRLAAGGWNESNKVRTGKSAAASKDVDDPSQCTHRTYHCHHATHTYMGVPCVAYLKPNRPPLLPKINTKPVTSKSARPLNGKQNLATVDPKQPVMLEIKHGHQIQKFSLPTEKLDKNKKYQLTFTIGPGGANDSKIDSKMNGPILKPLRNV